MRGYVEMYNPSSVVSQNQEHVKDLKPDCRRGKEVNRHHGLDMILKKDPPGLRRRLLLAYDVLGHAGLTEADAEFEQFAMDARRAPKGIFTAHFADQFAHGFRNRGAADPAVTNSPRPEKPEAFTVPSNNGFGPDDDQGRSPIAPDFA